MIVSDEWPAFVIPSDKQVPVLASLSNVLWIWKHEDQYINI